MKDLIFYFMVGFTLFLVIDNALLRMKMRVSGSKQGATVMMLDVILEFVLKEQKIPYKDLERYINSHDFTKNHCRVEIQKEEVKQ